MEIENLFRYPALAVGLKPSAIQGKARLRGLYRIISSKTIRRQLSARRAASGPPVTAHPLLRSLAASVAFLSRYFRYSTR
jgi:hypothetical protein